MDQFLAWWQARPTWQKIALVAVVAAFIATPFVNRDDDTTATTQPTSQTSTPGVALSEACRQAFEAAAAVSDMQDTMEDMYPAAQVCASIAEWTAASDVYPLALDGADPVTFLQNMCTYGAPSAVAQSTLCRQATGS